MGESTYIYREKYRKRPQIHQLHHRTPPRGGPAGISGLPHFIHTSTYDAAGRPDTLTYPSGFGYQNVYDANGYLVQVRNKTTTTTVYWSANTRDAEGRVTKETLGNGLITNRAYKPDTGYVDTLQIGTGAAPTSVQNDAYIFDVDALGNLTSRNQALGSGLETPMPTPARATPAPAAAATACAAPAARWPAASPLVPTAIN